MRASSRRGAGRREAGDAVLAVPQRLSAGEELVEVGNRQRARRDDVARGVGDAADLVDAYGGALAETTTSASIASEEDDGEGAAAAG